MNVFADIEARVLFPRWISEIERRGHGHLAVTWNQVKMGFNLGKHPVKWDRAVENENSGDRERDRRAFEV